MHCNKVYRELLDSVMTWKRSLTSELLMMFYGDMMHLPVTDKEVESLRATIIDSKKRYRFVRVNVMRIYGFNRMPLENLDNMAADFWDAYLKHETWINSLQVLHEQPPDLKFAFQTQSHLKFYSHIFGELNWILSRLSDAPKCQKLPDETINTCLSHVIGQLLLKEASQIIDETRRNQEEAEKKRQKDAEEAEADLLQSLKITDEQMKKNKKKKSNTQTNSKINITTPSPASASSTIFVKEESNQEPKIDNVPSQSTLKTPNILDHGDNDDERDPGEWETTSSKKKASKTLSSSSTFIENWISKSICEVRISEEFSHLILGENRKRIVDIVKSTGSQIKISDELLNGFRTFRVAGRPFENPSVAAENAQKTVSEMKYRLDHDGWGPMDIENRFEVLNSSIPIIFGTHKKNRMYQMDCLIYIEPVPSSTKTKFLFIRGLLVHVESATKIFQKYAVSSTVTFDSDNHFSPQRNSFPEDEKLKEEAKNASKTVASQQVEDMDEEFLRVLQLSAQEEEFRKRNEEEKKRQEEKHLDEEKTTQNELSKEIQEMEDSKLARALMEEEEKQHSLSLSSVPSSPKKTLAAMNTSQHTQRKNIQNQTSALNPTVKPILQEVPFNNYIENWKDDHLVIQMPQAFFGKVMGSSGSTLKQIEKESKTKIEYFKDLDEKQLHNRARRFFIHGNRNNIAYCVRRMKEEIGEDKTFMLPSSVQAKMFVDQTKPIKEFETYSKTRLVFHQQAAQNAFRNVSVSGSPESIRICKLLFEEMIVTNCSAAQALSNLAARKNRPLSVSSNPSGANITSIRSAHQPANVNSTKATFRGIGGGLSNFRGENSCFLNVVVQSFFHFPSFASQILRSRHSRCKSKENPPGKCLVCSLLNTFRALSSSEEGTFVSSVELREAVADAFEGSFDLGKMEDAAEAFERVLGAVHLSLIEEEEIGKEDKSTKPCDCIVHRCFAFYFLEGVKCDKCQRELTYEKEGEDLERNTRIKTLRTHSVVPLRPKYPSLVSYVSAAEIVSYDSTDSFQEKVKKSMEIMPVSCPSCNKSGLPVERIITRVPTDVFSLGIVFASENPDPLKDVKPLLDCISQELDIAALTKIRTVDSAKDVILKSCPSILRGTICFYRKHYVAFFRKKMSDDWFEFDDANVKPIGPSWEHAKKTIFSKKYQPVVLFYELVQD